MITLITVCRIIHVLFWAIKTENRVGSLLLVLKKKSFTEKKYIFFSHLEGGAIKENWLHFTGKKKKKRRSIDSN